MYSIHYTMASFTALNATTTFNHTVKQNTYNGRKGQDGAASGTTTIGGKKVDYLVVYDGHGGGQNRDVTVNYLRMIDWVKLLATDNFYSTLSQNLKKRDTTGCGSTLSICLIFDTHFDLFWIGDSTIRIYDEKEEICRSKDHNEKNPLEITRMKELGIDILKKKRMGGPIYTTKILEKDTIDMVQGVLFDFGIRDTLNMSHALGHNNCTGDFISHNLIPRQNEKKYKVVIGTDGLWDLIHDETHNEFLMDKKNQSDEIVNLAHGLWTQKWNYHETVTSFSTSNIDDIGVAVWSN